MKFLKKRNGAVSGIAVSIDEDEIFSSSYDWTLRIWDASTSTERKGYRRLVVFVVSHIA